MSQEIINTLKVRVFDTEETLRAERENINQFMQQLVQTLKVQPDQSGNVTVEAIVSRAAKLVALEEADMELPAGVIADEE